jgi:23S rRNA C2498 (ribose-2'-O)-methylase RlmM
MGFETVVLDKVAAVLGTYNKAEFFNGTLFVEAEEKDARRVFSMLCKNYDFKVRPSKVGDEFAYDFI